MLEVLAPPALLRRVFFDLVGVGWMTWTLGTRRADPGEGGEGSGNPAPGGLFHSPDREEVRADTSIPVLPELAHLPASEDVRAETAGGWM